MVFSIKRAFGFLGLLLVAQACVAGNTSALDPWPWRAQFHPKVKAHTVFDLQGSGEDAVVNAVANQSYGSWVDAFKTPTVLHTLAWRWAVLKQPEGANLKSKSGDDAAAKVCVFVHIDESRLSFGTRMELGAARMVSSEPLPAATLCYVWGNNTAQVNDIFPNPYTDLVVNWILQNDPESAQWRDEKRDLQADARRVFGRLLPGGPVRFEGVAFGSDSDNTNSVARAGFSSFTAR